MAKAKIGDTVKVHYTGTLDDGSEFDSSQGSEPLEFVIGSGQLIPGFDKAVTGLDVLGSITVTIPPEEAYGQARNDMMIKVPRDQVPAELQPAVGMQLEMSQPTGQRMMVTITEITDDSITLNGNHPLAGKTLTFAIELVEICE